MGADKALLPLAGEALAARLARRVARAAGSAALLGDPSRYAHLGWDVIPDIEPGAGPLSGIHAALARRLARWNLIVACDLPFLTVEFLRYLAGIAIESDPLLSGGGSAPEGNQAPGLAEPRPGRRPDPRPEPQLVVPVTPGGYELAIVIRDDALPAVEEGLAQRQFKLAHLYERLRCRAVTEEEYRSFDPRGILFENINTPEDLANVQSRSAGWGPETAEK